MKKSVVIFVALFVSTAIYANTVGVSLSYSHNMEYAQKIIEEVKYINQDFAVRIIEHSGKELRLDAQYLTSTNKFLRHRFLLKALLTTSPMLKPYF